jgi:hypothetical protein
LGYCFEYVHYGNFEATETVAQFTEEHYTHLLNAGKEVAA